MSIEDLIQNLETHWDTDGFLDAVRRGNFVSSDADGFLGLVRGITIGEDESVPKRLLSLLWYLPSFLEWQKERVAEVSPAQKLAYERFVTDVHNALEKVLGIP
jgi:hypothetical protein